MQSKYINDELSRQRYGLDHALKQIEEDCTCQHCRSKYSNSKDANNCCLEGVK